MERIEEIYKELGDIKRRISGTGFNAIESNQENNEVKKEEEQEKEEEEKRPMTIKERKLFYE